MAFFLKSLFGDSGKKNEDDKPESVTETETKKCMNCLRRISAVYEKCPHCRSSEFNYN